MSGHLLVDMGNQRIKWLYLESDSHPSYSQLDAMIEQSIQSASLSDAAPIEQQFYEMFNHCPAPDEILLSSVSADRVVEHFQQFCDNQWNQSVRIMRSERECLGLVNGYGNPTQLGVDRWLAAVAGFKLSESCSKGGRLVVIDAGTAITVDLIEQRCYQGGAILPGLSILIKSLGGDTGKIHVDFEQLAKFSSASASSNRSGEEPATKLEVVARDSASAVQAGALAAAAGGVNYCIEQIIGRGAEQSEILLCGGDAQVIGPLLDLPVKIMCNLVISGLVIIAMENQQ